MSLSYCEGVTTFLGSSVPACVQKLSALFSRKLKVRPLIHSDREVGMAVLSGQTSPRVPLDRCPATPRPLRVSARRDAALLCSAGGFPGAAR